MSAPTPDAALDALAEEAEREAADTDVLDFLAGVGWRPDKIA